MNQKAQQKAAARERILDSAAQLFREKGLNGAGVAEIMNSAGLTHGGFYAHFSNKSDLVNHAFTHALDNSREIWFADLNDCSPETTLKTIVNRYLSRDHRDNLDKGCPLPPLAAALSNNKEESAATVEAGIKKTVKRTSEQIKDLQNPIDENATDESLAILSLIVGGMLLSRSVDSESFSERILKSCRKMALRDLNID